MERGEYVAVMGPSGSGKSTLLQLIGCLDRPTRGRYVLDGTPVADLDDEELSRLRSRKIGFVFQAFHLIPQLDVAENVELPLIYQGVDAALRAERSADVLARVGLAERSRHRPRELSGGECQRVAIARALVADPDLLLADEPTGNLDSTTGEEIMDLIDGLNEKGVSVVLVTHDLAKARRARRVVLMRDGTVARELPGAEKEGMLDSLDAPREPRARRRG
jgi:putative ABC transport system ATP-binding protein